MKKVTIISGAQGVGKTTKAREMVEGKNVFETTDTLHEALRVMPSDTEVIILNLHFMSDILNAIRLDYLQVRPPYAKNFITVKVPELIITTCESMQFIEKIQAVEILKLTQILK